MRTIYRELALLFAGALASIIGTLLIKSPATNGTILLLCLAIILLILYGTGVITTMNHKRNLFTRKINKIIGIFNDMAWETENKEISAWTNISPVDWKNAIEQYAITNKARIKVRLMSIDDNFDRYTAILNPYGGVYPERNLKEYTTLNRIFDYVEHEGIFINVADIPGYWAYNPLLKRRLDATPQIYGTVQDKSGKIAFVPARLFELTPFMERLGLRVLNTTSYSFSSSWSLENKSGINKQLAINADRAVVEEKNVVPIIKSQVFNGFKVTPIFYTKYGDGKFLTSLIWFDSSRKLNDSVRDLLIELIIEEICN